jgi:hypothetical protein
MADSPSATEDTMDRYERRECGFGGCRRPLVLKGSVLQRLRLVWSRT